MNILAILSFAAGVLMAQTSAPQEEVLRLVKEGHFGEARQLTSRLIVEAEHSGVDIPDRAGLSQVLGIAEIEAGRYYEAESALKKGLSLFDRHPSAAPQVMISLLVLLADAHTAQGQTHEAEAVLRRAVKTAERYLPAGHPGFASALSALGTLYWTRGQMSRAEAAYLKSLAILEANFGATHPDFNVLLSNLAGLLVMTGRRAEAIPMLESAQKRLQEAYGPADLLCIGVGYDLAVALTKSEPSRAESLLRQSLSGWRVSRPELHPNTAAFLNALAWTRYEQGDVREAIVLNERALEISREVLGVWHSQVMSIMYDRAQLLKAAKRGKEAATLKEQADKIREAMGYAEIGRHSIDIHALSRK